VAVVEERVSFLKINRFLYTLCRMCTGGESFLTLVLSHEIVTLSSPSFPPCPWARAKGVSKRRAASSPSKVRELARA
jgi:hypothetical protein